jgi:sn-glycerol 3-phosphate transport system permease protein
MDDVVFYCPEQRNPAAEQYGNAGQNNVANKLFLQKRLNDLPAINIDAFPSVHSYPGLILPLIASATGTFLFRQFFMTIPSELCDAAKIDGAGPIRFLWSILLPMSRTPLAALSVIVFIYGWNQYLWPLLITTDPAMTTALIGIAKSMPSSDAEASWSVTMAGTLIVTFCQSACKFRSDSLLMQFEGCLAL